MKFLIGFVLGLVMGLLTLVASVASFFGGFVAAKGIYETSAEDVEEATDRYVGENPS